MEIPNPNQVQFTSSKFTSITTFLLVVSLRSNIIVAISTNVQKFLAFLPSKQFDFVPISYEYQIFNQTKLENIEKFDFQDFKNYQALLYPLFVERNVNNRQN